MKTLAQKAADKQLTEAVQRMIEAYKLLPDGHMMIEFMVLIEGTRLEEDEDGDRLESLGIAFRDGVCRSSVARGLLDMGREALRADYVREEESD